MLAESALFGHWKGAFAGAISDRADFLREADKGILFLDEV
jgi:transcriptional regulatory protein RtcR